MSQGADRLFAIALAAREAADWPRVVVVCGHLLASGAAPPGTRVLLQEARDALYQRRSTPEDFQEHASIAPALTAGSDAAP